MTGGFQAGAFQTNYQQQGVVTQPFVGGGGWWRPPVVKKKKKEAKIVELENVAIIPSSPEDQSRVYRYLGDLAPELTNIRLRMMEMRDALAYARQENERIRKEKRVDPNDGEFLIIVSMIEEDEKPIRNEIMGLIDKIRSML
jgi:hypothetical protein